MLGQHKAVVFDAGETLFSEERLWREWADWLSVPVPRLLECLDQAIQEGLSHISAFQRVKPGFDIERERIARSEQGNEERFMASDLYPDALPAIKRLKNEGYVIGVAGNHPQGFTDCIRDLEPRIDFVASSEQWGARKPDSGFFERMAAEVRLPPGRIACVGDRIDNDVVPAIRAGMIGVFLRRGRWGSVQRNWPDAARAHARIDSLEVLPDILPGLLPYHQSH
jgi:HAD superfamily hydrolase (TIGR01549 family)